MMNEQETYKFLRENTTRKVKKVQGRHNLGHIFVNNSGLFYCETCQKYPKIGLEIDEEGYVVVEEKKTLSDKAVHADDLEGIGFFYDHDDVKEALKEFISDIMINVSPEQHLKIKEKALIKFGDRLI